MSTAAGSGERGHHDGEGATAQFSWLGAMVQLPGARGRVAVADENNIRIFDLEAGRVATLGGNLPGAIRGMAVNAAGRLHVSLWDHSIRTVSSDGKEVELLCGKPREHGHVDGAAAVARFRYPQGMAFDSKQQLLVNLKLIFFSLSFLSVVSFC